MESHRRKDEYLSNDEKVIFDKITEVFWVAIPKDEDGQLQVEIDNHNLRDLHDFGYFEEGDFEKELIPSAHILQSLVELSGFDPLNLSQEMKKLYVKLMLVVL